MITLKTTPATGEPALSIVIVSWNAKQYLLNCLRSLAEARDEQDIEILVIDNASTDGSCEAVDEHYPEVILIRNETNLGFAKANNIGLRKSRGRYVCLINSDVVVFPGCLHTLSTYMEEHPGVGMIGPRILNPDGTLQTSIGLLPSLGRLMGLSIGLNRLFPRSSVFSGLHLSPRAHRHTRSVEVMIGCFWMVRHSAFTDVGLLDEDFFIYGEDIDWCKRFSEAGWKIIYHTDAEAIHFGGASSSRAPTRFFLEKKKADLRYWKKHHGRIACACYLAISFLHQGARILGRGLLCVLRPAERFGHMPYLKREFAWLRMLLHM